MSSIYEVAAAESCADGKTGNNNRITAVFSTADGENLAEIIPLAERILTVEQVSDNEVLIVHSNQKSTVGAVFSVQTGKKIRDANLSLAEQ